MRLRDHEPIEIGLNGLWDRGDIEHVPIDHSTDENNFKSVGMASAQTRDGIDISQDVAVPLSNIKRIYNFPTNQGNNLIVLAYNYITDMGSIYHVVSATQVFGPLLTISKMTDFAFVPYAGRGYISPFTSQLPAIPEPANGPGLTLVPSGNGVNPGAHNYAVTFITAAGETIPSPITTVTTFDTLANPTATPLITDFGVGFGNSLVAGGSYKWLFVYKRQDGSHTSTGPQSLAFVPASTLRNVGLQSDQTIPTNAYYVDIYRTTNGGVTFFQEFANLLVGNIPSPTINPTAHLIVGTLSDATISGRPVAPVTNTTKEEEVDLTAIAVSSSAGVTSRKIYRTVAGGTQLKLLTTIANNSATTFNDTADDSTLGTNAPTKNTATVGTVFFDLGLQGEFLYVYRGDGTAATKAAGAAMTGTMTINSGSGQTDPGAHVFGFVSETDTGYLSPPGILTEFTTSGSGVSFNNIPTSGDPHVVRRHLVATKVIPSFNGDLTGSQFFFVPNATINNNVDIFLNNIGFFDADLLDDATHLLENFTSIPAGAVLTLYHNRLILAATFEFPSVLYASAVGEPEAMDQVDGLIVVPPDGNAISNAIELRDVLYTFKRARTASFADNGDVPSSWPLVEVDNALGTQVHGIATVLDSGSSNVDFLLICTYQGLSMFNGRYILPELSWKIENRWRSFDRTQFNKIQILNATIQKWILIVMPDRTMLQADYSNGMDPKKIRWRPWSFLMKVNTVAIHEIDEIIFGADLVV